MLRKSGWAIGLVFMLVPVALGQAPATVVPATPNPPMEASSELGSVFVEPPRRSSLFYVDADYLLWWVHNGPAPTLLTTAPNNGKNANGLTGGIIGQPGTEVLFDSHQLDYGTFSGLRGTVGINLSDDGMWSLEIGAFYLPRNSVDFIRSGNANGTPLLTIPFIDAATGLNQSLDISSQDANSKPYLNGSILIHSDIQVWGSEANLVAHSIRTPDRTVDLWLGFRTLSMVENLNINQTISPAATGDINFQYPTVGNGQPAPPTPANYLSPTAGSQVFVGDHFGTRNDFYGAQVGTRFGWIFDRFSAELNLKVALGVTHQLANIEGSSTATQVQDPNTGNVFGPVTTKGGTFALASNIGTYQQTPFSVVPEINFNLKYAITTQLTLMVGYGATYWSDVARPGAQIDPVLNSKLVPTGSLLPTTTPGLNPGQYVPGQEQARPSFAFHDTAFWAQGVNFGLEFRY